MTPLYPSSHPPARCVVQLDPYGTNYVDGANLGDGTNNSGGAFGGGGGAGAGADSDAESALKKQMQKSQLQMTRQAKRMRQIHPMLHGALCGACSC